MFRVNNRQTAHPEPKKASEQKNRTSFWLAGHIPDISWKTCNESHNRLHNLRISKSDLKILLSVYTTWWK